MTVTIEAQALKNAVSQLRQIAVFLEGLIPVERDAHLPPHRRLDYITRSRGFGDAAASRARKKGGK